MTERFPGQFHADDPAPYAGLPDSQQGSLADERESAVEIEKPFHTGLERVDIEVGPVIENAGLDAANAGWPGNASLRTEA